MDSSRNTVSGVEQKQIARALLDWLNALQPLPPRVGKIEAEFLSASTSMGLFAAAAPLKIQEFISGAYVAQFPFSLLYRTAPVCSEQRLDAMEALDALAERAEREAPPELGEKILALSVERSSNAVAADRCGDGSEDYQILMVLTYQVRP